MRSTRVNPDSVSSAPINEPRLSHSLSLPLWLEWESAVQIQPSLFHFVIAATSPLATLRMLLHASVSAPAIVEVSSRVTSQREERTTKER